jgi:hypothetical protein
LGFFVHFGLEEDVSNRAIASGLVSPNAHGRLTIS